MKKNKDITIVDLSESLGLSLSTVSRALSNHPYVKEETREKVLEAAERMGYRRNIFASSLRQSRTFNIGLIVPRISMYFHAGVITFIQKELFKHGYNLVICQSDDNVKVEKELVKALYHARMDAVIAASSIHTADYSHFDLLVKNNIPLIFYDRTPTYSYPAYSVKGDDFQGGYMATTHLIETGCGRIAHISGLLSCNLYQERLKGYQHALSQHGITFDPSLLYCHELTYENARKTLYKIFKQPPYPDAIFAANDTTAIAVVEFAKERGIAIPSQLKLVGYSNDPRTSIITPSITTIEQFPEEMGNTIVEAVISLLNKKDDTQMPLLTGNELIPVKLIRRMST